MAKNYGPAKVKLKRGTCITEFNETVSNKSQLSYLSEMKTKKKIVIIGKKS